MMKTQTEQINYLPVQQIPDKVTMRRMYSLPRLL